MSEIVIERFTQHPENQDSLGTPPGQSRRGIPLFRLLRSAKRDRSPVEGTSGDSLRPKRNVPTPADDPQPRGNVVLHQEYDGVVRPCASIGTDRNCHQEQYHRRSRSHRVLRSPSRILNIHLRSAEMPSPHHHGEESQTAPLRQRGAPTTDQNAGRNTSNKRPVRHFYQGCACVLFTLEHQTDNGTKRMSQQVSASHTH